MFCKKCKTEKDLSEFYKCSKNKTGYAYTCKICKRAVLKNKMNSNSFYDENINKTKKCTKCGIIQDISEYMVDKVKKCGLRPSCKKCKLSHEKQYRIDNREYILEKERKIRLTDDYKKRKRKSDRKYKQAHKEELKKKFYFKYYNDIEFRMIQLARGRLKTYLRCNGIYKNNKTIKTIGISKKLFAKWIAWNLKLDKLNMLDVHLDHVVPIASFNCKTFDEVIKSKCNHWTNIMPLTEKDNLEKGSRMPTKKEKLNMDLRIIIFKIRNNLD